MDDKTLKKLLAFGLLAGAGFYFWKTQMQEKFAPIVVENGNMTLTGSDDVAGTPAGYGRQVEDMATVPEQMPEADPNAMPLPIDATKEDYPEAVVAPVVPEAPKAELDGITPFDEPVVYADLEPQA